MSDFLDKIRRLKQEEIEERKRRCPLAELKAEIKDLPPARDFKGALSGPGLALIAEIKRASPSGGILSAELDPAETARVYEKGGASAISVLTEATHFKGELPHIKAVKEAVSLPVLQKDFILDEYQVYESRAGGADAFLLISELLTPQEIRAFLKLGYSLGLSCLAEAHGRRELEKLVATGAEIIGINNRNLQTLQVDLETSLKLLPLIPSDRIKVSESGIRTGADVSRLFRAGADAVLVGESFVRSKDKAEKIRELIRGKT